MGFEDEPGPQPHDPQVNNRDESRVSEGKDILDGVIYFVSNSTVSSDLRKQENQEENNVNVVLHIVHIED
jgi:hypothetical protein